MANEGKDKAKKILDESYEEKDDDGCAPSAREEDYACMLPGVKPISAVNGKELQADFVKRSRHEQAITVSMDRQVIKAGQVISGTRAEFEDMDAANETSRAPSGSPVRLILTLELDLLLYRGMEEILGAGVANDVANAVAGRRDKILVQRLEPGSIVVHMLLCEGVCDNLSPLSVARDLQQQVQESSSLLRQGTYTCRAVSVEIAHQGLDSLIRTHTSGPFDSTSMKVRDLPKHVNHMRELSCSPAMSMFNLTSELVYSTLEQPTYNLSAGGPLDVQMHAVGTSSASSGTSSAQDASLPPLVPAALLATDCGNAVVWTV